MCTPTQGVWQPAGCVSCEPDCVCVSLVRVVIICPASTHTALVSSPSLAVLHLTTYLPMSVCVCVCVCESAVATAMSAGCRLVLSPRWRRGPVPRLRALLWARGGSPSRCRTM